MARLACSRPVARPSISSASLVVALTLAAIFSSRGSLRAQDAPAAAKTAAAEFPRELVEFVPEARNPLFAGAGGDAWDADIRERGWILREGDRWRMWYTGFDGTRAGVKRLGVADSADGLSWTRRVDNPSGDFDWVEDVCVVRLAGLYHLFGEGRGDIAFRATSAEGLKWRDAGPLDIRLKNGAPLSAGPRGTPFAWHDGTRWLLTYERGDHHVWLAASPDLKVWTNVQDEPILSPGPAEYDRGAVAVNQVFRHGGKWYASYHASDSELPGRKWVSCLAVSDDLIHWRKYPANPLLGDNKSSGIYVPDGEDRYRLYTMHRQVQLHWPAPKP